MLIDLEELAGEIASKVDGAGLTPVIEKEIVHFFNMSRTLSIGNEGPRANFFVLGPIYLLRNPR